MLITKENLWSTSPCPDAGACLTLVCLKPLQRPEYDLGPCPPIAEENILYEEVLSLEFLVTGAIRGRPFGIITNAAHAKDPRLASAAKELRSAVGVNLATRLPLSTDKSPLAEFFSFSEKQGLKVQMFLQEGPGSSNLLFWPKPLRDRYLFSLQTPRHPTPLDTSVLGIAENPGLGGVATLKEWVLKNRTYPRAGSSPACPSQSALRRARRSKAGLRGEAVCVSTPKPWRTNGGIRGVMLDFANNPSRKTFLLTDSTLRSFVMRHPRDCFFWGDPQSDAAGQHSHESIKQAVSRGDAAFVFFNSMEMVLSRDLPHCATNYHQMALRTGVLYAAPALTATAKWRSDLCENYSNFLINRNLDLTSAIIDEENICTLPLQWNE